MLRDTSNLAPHGGPASAAASRPSNRLSCIASQLAAPAASHSAVAAGDGVPVVLSQPLPPPLSQGIAALARSMATDETIMLRVRELVSQQLMQQQQQHHLEDMGSISSADGVAPSGWDVVSDTSCQSSPFVPVNRPPGHRHSYAAAAAAASPVGQPHHAIAPDSSYGEDDFEQLFSIPFRRVTSADFSGLGTPCRGHHGPGSSAGTASSPLLPQCSRLVPSALHHPRLSPLEPGGADDGAQTTDEASYTRSGSCATNGAEDGHHHHPAPSAAASSASLHQQQVCTAPAVSSSTTSTSFLDLITRTSSRMCTGVTRTLWALWDALRESFFPLGMLRRRHGGGRGGKAPGASSLGASFASSASEDDMEGRTMAFMSASAILVNAAMVFAVTHRLPVRQTVAQATGIIRDVFTTGFL